MLAGQCWLCRYMTGVECEMLPQSSLSDLPGHQFVSSQNTCTTSNIVGWPSFVLLMWKLVTLWRKNLLDNVESGRGAQCLREEIGELKISTTKCGEWRPVGTMTGVGVRLSGLARGQQRKEQVVPHSHTAHIRLQRSLSGAPGLTRVPGYGLVDGDNIRNGLRGHLWAESTGSLMFM